MTTPLPFHFNPEWYYFPINKHTGKPLKGWQTVSTNDPQKIQQWMSRWPGCLFGLDTGKSNLVVLDVDRKNGKDGTPHLSALTVDHGFLPSGFTVDTPSNGTHLYFTGRTRNRVGFVGAGLDVRSVGGFVVAPGVTKGGKKYEVKCPKSPPPAPEWLVAQIGQPNTQDASHSIPLVEYDLPHNTQKAIEYLTNHAPEANEGERDATCYKVACRVRDFGISHAAAKELMTDYYLSKIELSDSFGPETMEAKIDSAYLHACDRPGNDTEEGYAEKAREAFMGLTGEDMPEGQEFEEALPASEWVHISQFTKEPAPEREWIIENWLPHGFSAPTLLTGDGGTGKSLIAMQLAIAISTGTPWMTMPVLRKMPVAMILCEDSHNEIHRRVQSIVSADMTILDRMEAANVFFMSRVGKDCVICREDNGVLKDGPFMLGLHQQLKHLGPGEKVLILDTAADIYSGNESNRTGVTQFIKHKLCGLAEIHNATIIIIAHPPKSNNTYSGSTAWNNSVRNRLYLSWHSEKEKNDWRRLSSEKSNYSKCGNSMVLRWLNGSFSPVPESKMSSVVEELVYNEIKAFNEAANKAQSPIRLSTKPNSKYHICKRKIYDPVAGKRLSPPEIRDAVLRLLTMNMLVEVNSRKHGNGLYTTKQYDDEGMFGGFSEFT